MELSSKLLGHRPAHLCCHQGLGRVGCGGPCVLSLLHPHSPKKAPCTWGEEDGVGECRFQGAFCILKEVVYFLEGLSPALEGAVARPGTSPSHVCLAAAVTVGLALGGIGAWSWPSVGPGVSQRPRRPACVCVPIAWGVPACEWGAGLVLHPPSPQVWTQCMSPRISSTEGRRGLGRAGLRAAARPPPPSSEAEVARESRQHARPAGGAGPGDPCTLSSRPSI